MMAYLFREDQPPSMMAMTLIEPKAKIISSPTLRLRAARFRLQGMTARLIRAGDIISSGATRNKVVSTPAGTMSCLDMSLTASAMGWSKPA